MESYPTWIRLHPVATDPTLLTSVEARLADPLWLLGRQWQLGELHHDGGSTPLGVEVRGQVSPLTVLRAPSGHTVPLDAAAAPLEAMVEREPVAEDGLAGLELRMQAGLHLLRLLRAQGLEVASWIARFGFVAPPPDPLDAETRAFFEHVADRVPDGTRVASALPALLAGLPSGDPQRAPLEAWQRAYAARYEAAAPEARTWDPERMEHRFSVAGPGVDREVVLTVPEHAEGTLDWYSFEGGGAPIGATGVAEARVRHRLPGPLAFAGMPNPRFWTFEDPAVQFDAIGAGTPSAAASMVLDFALGYADDWFLIPVALDAWSAFQATHVLITDAFGDVAAAAPPAGRWNMFRLDEPGASAGLSPLFLHAPPAATLEGAPIEETHLLRDELANVAWAVERVVPHPLGRGREQATATPPENPPIERGLTWTFAPPAPPRCWFPLIPRSVGRLALGVLWSATDARPAGEILRELGEAGRGLHQEEVPLAGVQVTRRWQIARGRDGGLHAWVGRAKTPRRTDVAPGVRFDVVGW